MMDVAVSVLSQSGLGKPGLAEVHYLARLGKFDDPIPDVLRDAVPQAVGCGKWDRSTIWMISSFSEAAYLIRRPL